jgi:glycosyltransferase involved in cell wall biosynthesis
VSRVSICSSILNQSDLAKGMIESVIAQTFTDWELIIVDDGSTEDLSPLCTDPRIKLHKFPENRGVPHGINHALSLATGEFIGVLSADERLDPEKLAIQIDYLDEHPNVGAVWGLPQNGQMGLRPSWEQFGLRAHNRSREAWIRTLLNLENIPIGGASMLMRKRCMDEIGLFDPEHFTASDLEWFVRFFEKFEGRVLPYRWAIEAERKDTPLRKTVTAAQFQADMEKVRAKHSCKPPKVMAEVTIAIPVRNMASTVAATLHSVLAQTWSHWKIVVLDDASTDNTMDIVRSFTDPRISLMAFDENRGCNEAQNQMLARCDSPFFCVLAADDLIEPTFLEECISQFTQDPWLEFVASQTDFIGLDGAPHTTAHPIKDIAKARNLSRDQWLALLWYGNVYFGCGVYRTYAAKDVGGWDTTVGVLGDYDMYLKLLQRENLKIIEKPLTHTRIHENQRSIGKTAQWRKDLVQHYSIIKRRYYPPRPKVIIATPFYEMRGFSPYIRSMVATVRLLTSQGIDHDFWELSGDSYVDRAKNTIMTRFLEDPDSTDLVMIDSDMEWNADALLKMLALPEEIVVGSYPQKNAWGKWTGIPETVMEDGKSHPVGRVLDNGTALLRSAYLAGGFMRLKRIALEKFREAYPDLTYHDSSADPSEPDRIYTEFCSCEIAKDKEEDGVRLRWGEDRVMGKRFKAIGIDCWIYPDVDFGHYGIRGWLGNYDKWLRKPANEQTAGDQGNVSRMT